MFVLPGENGRYAPLSGADGKRGELGVLRECGRRGRRQPGPVTLASGRWDGVPWRLAVSDNGMGGYCATVTDGSRHPTQSCGAIIVPGLDHRLSFFGAFRGTHA